MALFKFLFILCISLMSVYAFADTEIEATQHPIDAWYEEKLTEESVSSDSVMSEITYQAQVKWEAEMNHVYKRLMKKLSPLQQDSLRKSQQQWLKYREAESKAILEIVSSQQGTIHQLSGANSNMRLVRIRVQDLLAYEQEFSK